jgi:translation initiation factor 1A
VFKTDGETEYAQVTKMLGNSRVETLCIADGRSRQCKIRGSLRVWIQAGDIVLISLRDFQDTKADVIWKYTADEARKLKRSGALPDGTKLNENDAGGGAYVLSPCLFFPAAIFLLLRLTANWFVC